MAEGESSTVWTNSAIYWLKNKLHDHLYKLFNSCPAIYAEGFFFITIYLYKRLKCNIAKLVGNCYINSLMFLTVQISLVVVIVLHRFQYGKTGTSFK